MWLTPFLRRELAPTPQRGHITLRYVVTSMITLLISMTLQIPALSLSLILLFFTIQESARATFIAGKLLIIGATSALIATILLFAFTLGHPAARVIGAMLIVFGGMFFFARQPFRHRRLSDRRTVAVYAERSRCRLFGGNTGPHISLDVGGGRLSHRACRCAILASPCCTAAFGKGSSSVLRCRLAQ